MTPSASFQREAVQRPALTSTARSRSYSRGPRQPSLFPAWLLLTGVLLIPSSLAVHLAGEGFKFTPGRAAITLLLAPAFLKFLREHRRLVSSDLFIFLTCVWMIGSRLQDDGLNASAVAEVIELMGGYIVARTYFFGHQDLQNFMHVFKRLLLIIILLASLEPLLGRNAVTAITSSLFHTPVAETQIRFGIARAQSTIEDSELYGSLCCVGASLFLYIGPGGFRKVVWVAFCFFGCLLSISSGPLLAFLLVLATYGYDRMLRQYPWRWKLYVLTFVGLVGAIFIFSSRPIPWIISHLLFDPASSYFRLYVFDYYFEQIGLSPLIGWGFGPTGDDDFLANASVDNVWIVCAVRFGLPMIFFLLLANIATFFPFLSEAEKKHHDPYIDNAATAFTFSLVTLMGIGLSVHYWNAIWMLWAVCLGARASIKEFAASGKRRNGVSMGAKRQTRLAPA